MSEGVSHNIPEKRNKIFARTKISFYYQNVKETVELVGIQSRGTAGILVQYCSKTNIIMYICIV